MAAQLAQPPPSMTIPAQPSPTGAVAARLRIFDTPLCIVCSHLASGDAEGDELRRNADAMEILKRCAFPTDSQMQALGLSGESGGGGDGDGGG